MQRTKSQVFLAITGLVDWPLVNMRAEEREECPLSVWLMV